MTLHTRHWIKIASLVLKLVKKLIRKDKSNAQKKDVKKEKQKAV